MWIVTTRHEAAHCIRQYRRHGCWVKVRQAGYEWQWSQGFLVCIERKPETPAQKAVNVARSILAHGLSPDALSTWQRYGIEYNVEQMTLVRQALRAMQIAAYQAAEGRA